jgi:hypothetical protein
MAATNSKRRPHADRKHVCEHCGAGTTSKYVPTGWVLTKVGHDSVKHCSHECYLADRPRVERLIALELGGVR